MAQSLSLPVIHVYISIHTRNKYGHTRICIYMVYMFGLYLCRRAIQRVVEATLLRLCLSTLWMYRFFGVYINEVYVQIYEYIYINISIHIHIFVFTYVYICMYLYIYIYIHIYMYIYM